MRPVVSVIICTYRRQEALKKCIESIQKQEYSAYEIIVVVPTEEADTLSMLKSYNSIKIIFQNIGEGLSVARNRGVAVADGEFVAFIDNDGIADNHWLENLVKTYSSDIIGAVGGIVYEASGNNLQFKNGSVNRFGDIEGVSNYYHQDYNDPNGKRFNMVMGTNFSVRKDLLLKLGGFNPEYHAFFEDGYIAFRVIKAGYEVAHNNDAIVFHSALDGLTRRGYWNYNWAEIMKTTMYFIITNFWGESSFETRLKILIHPLTFRLNETLACYLAHKISFSLAVRVWLRIAKGYFKGVIRSFLLSKTHSTTWVPPEGKY